MVRQTAQPLSLTKSQEISVSILFAKSWTRSLTAVWKSVSKMPWLSVQPMNWEIRSSLKKRQLNLAGSLLSLPSKPSWKRCASRPEQSLSIPIKSMKMKSCQERWSVLTIALSMSILAVLKRSYRNKTRFLVRSLPLMTASKSLSTR